MLVAVASSPTVGLLLMVVVAVETTALNGSMNGYLGNWWPSLALIIRSLTSLVAICFGS